MFNKYFKIVALIVFALSGLTFAFNNCAGDPKPLILKSGDPVITGDDTENLRECDYGGYYIGSSFYQNSGYYNDSGYYGDSAYDGNRSFYDQSGYYEDSGYYLDSGYYENSGAYYQATADCEDSGQIYYFNSN